jgi:hypothetical protein
MRVNPCVLVLVVFTACGRGSESTGPSSDPPPATLSAARARIDLEFVPVEADRMPIAVAARMGGELRRIGPLQQWRGTLPAAAGAGPLWVDSLGEEAAFYPLRVAVPSSTLQLPLVPRRRLPRSIYCELLDLLQEFIAPFAGSRVRRWGHRPLRVAWPEGTWRVDYGQACLDALEAINQALEGSWLVPVPPQEPADVVCEVLASDRLGFTQLVAVDATGHPTAMRVQLSPRWNEGAERYVRRAFLHEFGHVLGLWGHSRDLEHVVNGRAVIRDALHPDEIRALHWLWNLPADFDLVQLRRPRRPRPWPPRTPVTRCEAAMERGIAAIHPR